MRFSLYNDDPTGTYFLRVSLMRGDVEVRRLLIPPAGEGGGPPAVGSIPDDCHLVVKQDREWFGNDPTDVTEVPRSEW